MKKKWKKIVGDMPLKKKIFLITLTGVFVMVLAVLLAIQLIDSVYQKVLYQTLAESLAYTSKEISDYMEEMESLTGKILADESIQNDLVTIKTEPEDSLASINAMQRVRTAVLNYHVFGYDPAFRDGILRYITLYTDKSAIYTNLFYSKEVSEKVQNQMKEDAEQERGKPFWETKYVDEYGLFQGRSIRRIEGIKLDTLGIILLNIDMDELISDIMQFSNWCDEMGYVILEKDEVWYYTPNLSEDEVEQIQFASIKDYAVISLDRDNYFVVRGNIEEADWDYYCLVSYNDIVQQIENAKHMCAIITILDLVFALFLVNRLNSGLMVHFGRLTKKIQQYTTDNTIVPKTDYDYSDRKDEIGMLHRQFDQMSETSIRMIQEHYINEILIKEAQFKALENQINPHFLYNTLGTIRWRAEAIGEAKISEMVDALGTLMRHSLSKVDEKEYCIEKEIEIIKAYITIQKLRYGNRLIFKNQISEEFFKVHIPKLSIQPLVDNAIYYGVETSVGECMIFLTARCICGEVHIYIKNTGSEIEDGLLDKLENKEIIPHGNGIGLLNVHQRVRIQFGENYGLKMYNDGDWAVVELVVPFEGECIC